MYQIRIPTPFRVPPGKRRELGVLPHQRSNPGDMRGHCTAKDANPEFNPSRKQAA